MAAGANLETIDAEGRTLAHWCVRVCICVCVCCTYACACACVCVSVLYVCGCQSSSFTLPLTPSLGGTGLPLEGVRRLCRCCTNMGRSSTRGINSGEEGPPGLETQGDTCKARTRNVQHPKEQRETQTHTRVRTDTDTHTFTLTQTHRHTDTQTHRHTDTQTHRHTHRHTDRYRHTCRPAPCPLCCRTVAHRCTTRHFMGSGQRSRRCWTAAPVSAWPTTMASQRCTGPALVDTRTSLG